MKEGKREVRGKREEQSIDLLADFQHKVGATHAEFLDVLPRPSMSNGCRRDPMQADGIITD